MSHKLKMILLLQNATHRCLRSQIQRGNVTMPAGNVPDDDPGSIA